MTTHLMILDCGYLSKFEKRLNILERIHVNQIFFIRIKLMYK